MRPSFEPGQLVEFEVSSIPTIKRGDVIVMHFPLDPVRAAGCFRDFIKRVVALPGETIEIVQGSVFVDGVRLEEPYVAERLDPSPMGPVTLPEGEYFVLGDNRPMSNDSRDWGPLPARSIVGRVVTE